MLNIKSINYYNLLLIIITVTALILSILSFTNTDKFGNRKNSIKLSYAINTDRVYYFEHEKKNNTKSASWHSVRYLVKPYTNEKTDGFISFKGIDYKGFFDETYTILYKNSTVCFGLFYENMSESSIITSNTTIKFPIIYSNGIFEGASEVIIEYISNEYKSRIITINF